MSRDLALNAIKLQPTPRPGHTEYSVSTYHKKLLATELPNYQGNADDTRAFHRLWHYDFLWGVNDGPVNWGKQGRVTDMGHADYAEGGSDRREAKICPFTDPEEIYAFDPAREYGVPEHHDLVRFYQNWYQSQQAANPDQLCTMGYYKTIISGCIQAFGWDMLLLAAAEPERFAVVLKRFADYTAHYVRAQAECSAEVFIQHDDFVWTSGPFLHPDYYRQNIIPRYAELWQVLHRAGKKVLFCSDGTFTEFMPDLVAAGADGFIFEPSNDFEWVVRNFGQTHCLIGSAVDCRTMTFGSWEQVKAEMDRTHELAKSCRGLIWAVGNHIPANVPVDICQQYMAYLTTLWNL